MTYNLVKAISMFFNVITWLIVIRGLASIVIRDYSNPIMRMLNEITEPVLMPFRAIMNKLNLNTGVLDFSPLLAIITLNVIERLLIGIIL